MNVIPSAVQRALFLDRDGVINVNYGYVHSKDNFKFIDGIFELVRTARSLDYRVVIVTNQAGIGRGYYSDEQFHELTAWMCERFEHHDAHIDKVYYSPYHPTAGIGEYLQQEDTRKPGAGTILKAQRELGLSLEDSVFVGDKARDILAEAAAGVGLNILFSADFPAALTGLRPCVLPDECQLLS
jgi:D-glycero-D-manno-heptose 1,7-bisphosphate phosphatase